MKHEINARSCVNYVLLFLLALFALPQVSALAAPNDMPEFTNDNPDEWFNSAPLKRADLKGKVVLLDVWTYGCWNCYRSFPWLIEIEGKFSSNTFQVIGIHTPEFEHEKVAGNIFRSLAISLMAIINPPWTR